MSHMLRPMPSKPFSHRRPVEIVTTPSPGCGVSLALPASAAKRRQFGNRIRKALSRILHPDQVSRPSNDNVARLAVLLQGTPGAAYRVELRAVQKNTTLDLKPCIGIFPANGCAAHRRLIPFDGSPRLRMRWAGSGWLVPDDASHPPLSRSVTAKVKAVGNWPIPLTSTKPRPARVDQGAEYVVWYGTNRAPSRDPEKRYSNRLDNRVHYGSARVVVPRFHNVGSRGNRWWKKLLGAGDRLRVNGTTEMEADAFWTQVNAAITPTSASPQPAVVLIHGYNITFNEAAVMAAQIGLDLSIRSGMAFFSWPSRGTYGGYAADTVSVETCEDALAEFLCDFAQKSGASELHVLAHSMGSRATLRALDRIASDAQTRRSIRLGQCIFAAADVDVEWFRQRVRRIEGLSRRITLYASSTDRAVMASRWLHAFPRAGFLPPVAVEKGVDTIAVPNGDLFSFGHGYVEDNREVLSDIHNLIRAGSPPDERFGLRRVTTPSGETYWSIGG